MSSTTPSSTPPSNPVPEAGEIHREEKRGAPTARGLSPTERKINNVAQKSLPGSPGECDGEIYMDAQEQRNVVAPLSNNDSSSPAVGAKRVESAVGGLGGSGSSFKPISSLSGSPVDSAFHTPSSSPSTVASPLTDSTSPPVNVLGSQGGSPIATPAPVRMTAAHVAPVAPAPTTNTAPAAPAATPTGGAASVQTPPSPAATGVPGTMATKAAAATTAAGGAVSLVPVDLKKIQDELTAKETSDDASQAILGEVLKKLKEANAYTDVKLNGELESENGKGFQVEPFQISSEPGKTFYRIKVKYTITAKEGGKEIDPPLSFTRTISTKATKPEDAVMVAMLFKGTICKLAEKVSDPTLADPFEKDFVQNSSTNRTFSFDPGHKTGSFTHPKSMSFFDGKKTYEHMFQQQTKYGYHFKSPSQTMEGVKASDGGVAIFESEEQLILHRKGVSIKLDLSSSSLEETTAYAKQLKEEITKKQEEFEKVKANFVRNPLFSIFGKKEDPSNTVEFEEFKKQVEAFERIKSGGKIDRKDREISSAMAMYVDRKLEQRKESIEGELRYVKTSLSDLSSGAKSSSTYVNALLDELGVDYSGLDEVAKKKLVTEKLTTKKTELEKDIKARDKAIDDIEENISAGHRSFYDQLTELNRIQQELNVRTNKLDDLNKNAKELADNPGTAEDKGKAAAFLKAFPKASIEKLQDQNKKRSMGINKIIERLGITIVQSPVDATDGSF